MISLILISQWTRWRSAGSESEVKIQNREGKLKWLNEVCSVQILFLVYFCCCENWMKHFFVRSIPFSVSSVSVCFNLSPFSLPFFKFVSSIISWRNRSLLFIVFFAFSSHFSFISSYYYNHYRRNDDYLAFYI